MKRSLVFVVLILEEFFQTEAISITGTVGTAIKITCSHSYATTNVKYFCKGACNDADVLIKSNVPERVLNGKYLIKDEGNTFYVTITNLENSDAGVYWCGIDRVGADTYSKVTLTVKEENPVGSMKTSHSSLGVAVLALVTILLLFLRLRKRNVSTSHGKENDDIQYVTTVFQKNTQHANGTSSVSEEQGADARIYTDLSEVRHPNSSAEPKTQSDYLFYSTISFSDHPASGSVPPQSELTEYSSIKLK
ncbi:uncharacterized protein V3H82_000577 isoform 2-T2 [Fundulus diaphanus]